MLILYDGVLFATSWACVWVLILVVNLRHAVAVGCDVGLLILSGCSCGLVARGWVCGMIWGFGLGFNFGFCGCYWFVVV